MSRLRKRPGTKQYLESQSHIILNGAEYKGKWQEYFGNNRPIQAELGMGKGKFISEMSLRFPEINFIGIDRFDPLVRQASEKAISMREDWNKSGMDNLVLVRFNVEEIDQLFAENELDQIYLNFSDPWPKARHAKRRLTHPDFMEKYKTILKPEGHIQLRTDSVSLFEFSLNTFADMGLQMNGIYLDLHRDGMPEDHIYTEYEQRFVEEGIRIQQVNVKF